MNQPANIAREVDTGVDAYEPTARAISEHIGALKKTIAGGTSSARGTPTATPRKSTAGAGVSKSTPRKSALTKTPTTANGSKRKRAASNSSDEEMTEPEDTDDERMMLDATPSARRSTLSRRSKSVAKSYHDPEETGDDDAVASEEDAQAHAAEANAEVGTAFDGIKEQGAEVQVGGVASANGGVMNGTLIPQGKAANGTKTNGAAKRAIKREVLDEGTDGSDFVPDF